jgi:hypothetical protein
MPQSIFSISAAEKENKIAKVAHLIPKWYAEGSIVNEPAIVSKISKLLKPNQWLRLEDSRYGSYDYSKPITYEKQSKGFMKPTGIWASKGEWSFHGDRPLTLLEVDYSRILVITTKEDYLEFEDKYCKKLLRSRWTEKDWERQRRTRKSRRWEGGARNSKTIKNKKLVCTMNVNWDAVANDYDGIAFVPYGKPYFDRKEMLEYKNHIWVSSYDVSSLVIWRHNGTMPITRAISLGNTSNLYKPGNSELDNRQVIKVVKEGIKELEKITQQDKIKGQDKIKEHDKM